MREHDKESVCLYDRETDRKKEKDKASAVLCPAQSLLRAKERKIQRERAVRARSL